MSSNPKVYLAGPISHLAYKDAVAWRKTAQSILSTYSIAAYSPMRGKDYLDNANPVPAQQEVFAHPLSTSRGIMARDFNDCVRADALLVNFLGVTIRSLGTAMELAWAFDRHIPTVVISEPHNVNIDHPMMYAAAKFVVPTLREGIDLIRTILRPEV